MISIRIQPFFTRYRSLKSIYLTLLFSTYFCSLVDRLDLQSRGIYLNQQFLGVINYYSFSQVSFTIASPIVLSSFSIPNLVGLASYLALSLIIEARVPFISKSRLSLSAFLSSQLSIQITLALFFFSILIRNFKGLKPLKQLISSTTKAISLVIKNVISQLPKISFAEIITRFLLYTQYSIQIQKPCLRLKQKLTTIATQSIQSIDLFLSKNLARQFLTSRVFNFATRSSRVASRIYSQYLALFKAFILR